MSPFVFIIALFQLTLFLGHWLFYRTLVRFLGLPGSWPLKLALAALSISFMAASVLAFRQNGPFVRAFYALSASWLGLFHFLFWASVLCWISFWVHSALGLRFDSASWAAALLSLGVIAGLYGIANAQNPRVKKIDIALSGPPGLNDTLNDTWKGKTAVFISDLHLGPVRNMGFARRVAGRIRQLGPDILFIGGDLFDGTKSDAERLAEPFGQIHPPLGTYFITGNHEEFSESAKERYIRAVRHAGIEVLDNRMVVVDGLQIAGVDYRDTFTRAGYNRVLEKIGFTRGKAVLLLKHSPMYPGVSYRQGVTFEICGHTHKGQVFPVNFITHYVYRGFDGGLKRLGNLTVYTSAGTGTWGPPVRVGNRPEITFIRFL